MTLGKKRLSTTGLERTVDEALCGNELVGLVFAPVVLHNDLRVLLRLVDVQRGVRCAHHEERRVGRELGRRAQRWHSVGGGTGTAWGSAVLRQLPLEREVLYFTLRRACK